MTYSLKDRVVYQEIVGEAICTYTGMIAGRTVETEPKYDVLLDEGSLIQNVRARDLRPAGVVLGDEVA